MEADVVVIGGGMAGAVAALRAAECGAQVLLIRKGFGSTGMSSGTIDIAGAVDFFPLDPWDALPPVSAGLATILRTNLLHPYSIIAGGRDRTEYLQAALTRACEFLLSKIPGYGLRGSVEYHLALPNIFGTAKFSAFAPLSLFTGNLMNMQDAHLLVVGINGLPFFRSHLCSQALLNYCSIHPPAAISRVDTVEVYIPDSASMRAAAPFEIAQSFDNPQTCEKFVEQLNDKIEPDVTHVGLPALLGLNNHTEIFEMISRELQPKVFEMISPDIPIPGKRLQMALDAALVDSSVRMMAGEVIGIEKSDKEIESITIESMIKRRTAIAKNFIIATGKFSSGGLVGGDFLREPLLGLPVFYDGKCVNQKFVRDLLYPDFDERQPFLSCGIHVDAELHPLNRFNNPAFDNLFAAGSIIGGYDYIMDKCGLGVAILTGYVAGEKAAHQLKSGGETTCESST